MNRLIAFGVGLAWAGAAAAQYPVTPYTNWNPPPPRTAAPAPPTVVRTGGALDVTQPLPGMVSAMSPAAPPAGGNYAGCATGNCQAGCGQTSRPCLQRFQEWLCYAPGPRVLPPLTPTPYRAPLRQYFPCRSDCAAVVGGCNPDGGACAAGGCGPASPRFGGLGMGWLQRDNCGAGAGPRLRDRLPFARPAAADCAVPGPVGYGYSPQVAAVPCGTYATPYPAACEPARTSLFQRVCSWFSRRPSDCPAAYPAATLAPAMPITHPVATGPVMTTAPAAPQMAAPQPTATTSGLAGYRFASATTHYGVTGVTTAAPQPTAAQPFTRP